MKSKFFISIMIFVFIFLFAGITISNASKANIKTYTYNTTEKTNSTEISMNLETYTFNHPESAYDFLDENGNFNTVYASENNVYWAKFDENMKVIETITWPLFYNKNNEENISEVQKMLTYNFGGALYYNGYLYVMYSRVATYSTVQERDQEKVMAIVKYNKKGEIVKSNEFLGIVLNNHTYYSEFGTSVPFYSANCSLTANNGMIACFFGRNMFNNHQSSLLMIIDPETLEYVNNIKSDNISQTDFRKYYNLYNHYISHSFGQRIIPTSDGQFLMMETGDAGTAGATRGLNLTKIYEYNDEEFSQMILKETTTRMVHYSEGGPSNLGYNRTYSVLGNIIELSDGYMYIGGLDKQLNRAYGNRMDNPWNLFVQKYKKDFYTRDSIEDMQLLKTDVRTTSGVPATYNGYGRLYLTGDEKDYGMKWLTNLKDECVIGVRAVKTKEENVVILWEQFEIEKYYYQNEYMGYEPKNTYDRKMYYMIIDKDANVISEPMLIPGKRMSSEEQYIYKDGKIYWTTTETRSGNTNELNILDIENPNSIMLGDIDEDGKINPTDARKALLYYVGKEELTASQFQAADVNKDGKVNPTDARQILLYYVGKIEEF